MRSIRRTKQTVSRGSSRPLRSFGKQVGFTDRPLRFETLETRRLLAVFTVTNLSDAPVAAPGDAPGTLRQALYDSNNNAEVDTINFQAGLSGTLALNAGELSILDELSIVGPGAADLIIDAVGNDLISPGTSDGTGSRVLNIDDGNIFAAFSVSISGVTLTGGDVSGDGGGIRSNESLSLTAVKVNDNAAVGSGVRGGGIFSYGGDLTIDQSTISGNSTGGANSDGGGVYSTTRLFGTQATLISNTTISGNSATGNGGGIFTGNNLEQDQTTSIVNSTISGNIASNSGGGVFGFDGDTSIAHSTITDNTAPVGMGSGLASYGDVGTLTDVRSSIISGNSGEDLAVVSGNENSLTSSGYNVVGTGNTFGPVNEFSALDNFIATGDQTGVLDPGLVALADNGGLTWTHALLSTSPALDAGDPSAVANMGGVPQYDQRGTPFDRVANGSGGGSRIDVGAYELQAAPSADFDSNGVINGFDFLAWQRGFGTLAPNAVKLDGDADNDLDVDSDDFDQWDATFGQTAPAVVAVIYGETSTGVIGQEDFFSAAQALSLATQTTEDSTSSQLLADKIFLRPAMDEQFREHENSEIFSDWTMTVYSTREVVADLNPIVHNKRQNSEELVADEVFALLADDLLGYD